MSTHPLPTALVGRYTAGMPQLSSGGLSENWLLKECGHRHWLAIAQRQGQPVPEFRDAQGRKVYAAFSLVRIRQAQLERVEEHDAFSIATRCHPAGRTQYYSQHTVQLQGQLVARVEMLSVFVLRVQAGNNRSIVRAVMAMPQATAAPSDLASAAEAFVQRGRARRAAVGAGQAEAHASVFTPCPHNDFNGADLLYFSSFQSVVDRAEWAWMRSADAASRPAALREREMVFYGNLDLGDAVHTGLHGALLDHHSVLRRGSDGQRIGEVFTRKQAPQPRTLALAA
ncbi:Pnap_2097 family protein [Rhodoferax sp. WC2427]|uniref:Pnap_2097 family protein n=1 Tax=Rhodoferax sp. WC2427 TaxID=3234144 RepID=UPI003467A48F